jgi:hypothetical protein
VRITSASGTYDLVRRRIARAGGAAG